jgi:hypothetical protein
MAREARPGSTLGAPCWQEDVWMFVDWARATIPIYGRETGAAQPASLFVAVLGEFLRLCASHTQPGPFPLDRVLLTALRLISPSQSRLDFCTRLGTGLLA